jgi:hypothetical protein
MLVTIGSLIVDTQNGRTSLSLTELFLSGPPRDQLRVLEKVKSDADEAFLDVMDRALDEGERSFPETERQTVTR